jgi:DNA repair photolyase
MERRHCRNDRACNFGLSSVYVSAGTALHEIRAEDPMQQAQLPFDSPIRRRPPPIEAIGVQKDIRYYGTSAKGVLNSPETTGMGFWSINPYVGCAFGCAYCYARYAHRYVAERTIAAAAPDVPLRDDLAELPAWLAFERRIFVKRNAAEVLREQLRAARKGSRSMRRGSSRSGGLWRGEGIGIGTATDPYQPAERLFRVTRGVLEVLAEERGLAVWITTKSPLVTRDVDVLARIAARSEVTVHISLITLDRELARRIEPRAPTPEARVRAIARLAEAGIDTGVNIMPVLPGLTDQPAMLDALVRRVAEAGAGYINTCALRLQSSARRRYLPFIEQEFPHLAARYRAAYANGYQVSDRYREGLRRFLKARCREHGVRYGAEEDEEESANDGVSAEPDGEAVPGGGDPEPDEDRQLDLELGSG